MNRLNKTEFALFLYCSFSLYLKDPFFQIIYIGFINPFYTENLKRVPCQTVKANSKDPDEMEHTAAFHHGLHYLLRLK